MDGELPLYLVSGFLGSGKSTFLGRLIACEQDDGVRVGVIVNEIGSTSVDATVLERDGVQMLQVNNGSIFCACAQGAFARTLAQLLVSPVDMVFVEASGMADPFGIDDFVSQMEGALERRRGALPRHYSYRGSVCMVDATSLPDYADVLEPVGNQIRKSSFIVINKVDLATREELDETRAVVCALNPEAHTVETSYGIVSLGQLECHVDPALSRHGETSNVCGAKPASYALELPGFYDVASMRSFLERMSSFAVRQKGFFVDSDGLFQHVEAVGDRAVIDPFPCTAWKVPQRQIVMIGMNACPFDRDIAHQWGRCFPHHELHLKEG